ncbi:putative RNA-directed DNA polymerase [Tanacetum coccineum]
MNYNSIGNRKLTLIIKELNHTIIALISKVKAPMRVNDYRPISCCNVLFKCISKIIANRIKYCLKFIVSPNQSAFVPGRSITDNILLTQELMHNYHLDRGIPRCAFKVDIQKAYDTVDWSFLRMILHGFGFPDKMIAWIMECVSTTSYSISINGSLHGYFKGKRGLRQGDPLSPYLFTLVMEVLTLMLQRRVSMTEGFTYHRYCSKMDLINLCFADDLFLFAYGDVNSASIIKESLDEFKNASGLVPSLPKSTAYFCNVLNHVKLSILQILPFEEGRLPVKYLGVPLVSSRLMVRDCNELIDKVQIRVQDWKNKALSIAGRLQLIQSVLGSMHIYWASVFTLPSSVLLNIEQILRQFLWNHGSSGKAKSKVAWEIVCLPKDEGGLGIRRLECFNSALMASHIWKLLTLKESLWVKWIHEYKLKGRNFWDYPMRGNMSWGWRKILRLRPVIRRFIWSKLGNGHATSLWFDKWSTLEPLANFVSPRDVARAGLSLKSKVSDVLVYGNWSWPNDLVTKYPILPNYNTPINNELDRLAWSDRFGNIQKFSVSQVWSNIRSRNTKVDWYSMVWFPSCIPRHAINMWLIIRRKLETQDLIPYWDVSSSLGSVCSLCELTPDSHVHLFFECPFASDVWNRMRGLAGLNASNSNIYDIIHDIMPFVKRRTSESLVAKLVVAATAYYIWQERNWRLFQKGKRKVDQIVDCIKIVVRLKLLSCKLKKSKSGERLARLWDLPDAIFI